MLRKKLFPKCFFIVMLMMIIETVARRHCREGFCEDVLIYSLSLHYIFFSITQLQSVDVKVYGGKYVHARSIRREIFGKSDQNFMKKFNDFLGISKFLK